MALFFGEDLQEPGAIGWRGIREGQQSPGEELDSLQLMIGEGVQDARPLVGVMVSSDRWDLGLPDRPRRQLRRSSGFLYAQRRSRFAVLDVFGQGGEFKIDVFGKNDGFGDVSYLHMLIQQCLALPALWTAGGGEYQ